jgi:hypothetical protein
MVIVSLVLLWFIAGTLVWLFEARRNRDMFGDGSVKLRRLKERYFGSGG